MRKRYDYIPQLIGILLSLTYFSPPLYAQCNDSCVKVVAEGLGTSFDAALVQSAQNALMQVVGTFVDAEKSVKKRTEIRGVVKEQTKQVDKRFSTYTKGSIRSLEVLESSDDGGLFRVSSLVGVEVSEFKAAIRSQALSEEIAVPQSLYAQAANKNRQIESLAEILFDGQLMKVFSLDYVDVQVTEVGLVEDPRKIAMYETKLKPKKGDTLIRVHVTASLNDSFMQSLKDSLSQISASTYEGSRLSTVPERASEPSKRNNLFWVLLRDGEDRHKGKAGAAKSFEQHFGRWNPFVLEMNSASRGYAGYTFGSGVKNLDQAVLYTLPSPLAAKLCEEGRARLPTATPNRATGGTNVHGITPFVDLKLTDANGDTVLEDVIRDTSFEGLGRHIVVKSDTALVVSKNAFRANNSDGYAKPSLAFLEYSVRGGGSQIYSCYVGIDPVKEFVIVAALSENELASTSNVAVSLFR